ncbi:MAG TPA: META domain-containing protein [Patescibacteria group bacterium]|nr:META domain-containing protein [Patescibacteria group bacterium]
MRTRILLPFALLSSLLIGACTGAGGAGAPDPIGILPGSPGDPPARQGLDGRTFLSTSAVGRALVPGSQVRLSFFLDGRIGASAGCNSMGGAYTIDGDRLVATQLATTEIGCAPALMEQDLWLAGLLDGSTIDLAGDTLTLAKDGVRLSLLDRKVADPDRPLLGTRWVVDGLVSADAVSSVPAGVVGALTFSPGRVEVEAGCNRGGGDVTVTDTTIAFGPIALTKMACEDGAMEVERTVLAVLAGEVRYTIEAGGLLLDAGPVGLMLRAAP